MRAWHFTEQSYEPGWSRTDGMLRIEMPSQLCDPEEASDLLNRYLDEWMFCDEIGLDIMVNEHHASMTCMSSSCTLQLAALARQTKNARLLALGIPIANRPDPLRVAEEIAMLDLLSRGRLEVGFVRGVPFEIFCANLSPVRMRERYWESHDLIIKALTTREGPFTWEGENFHYRSVNIWPRGWQQPTPPIWMPCSTQSSAVSVAEHGYVCAAFFNGGGAKLTFAAYRKAFLQKFRKKAPRDRFGYSAMVCLGHNEAEAHRRAALMKTYLATLSRTPRGTLNPPGYRPIAATVAQLRASITGASTNTTITMVDGRPLPKNPTFDELAMSGTMFCGTPDQVFEQIRRFHDAVGGFGHLMLMGQSGALGHDDTLSNLGMFANDVYPRLKELADVEEQEVIAA